MFSNIAPPPRFKTLAYILSLLVGVLVGAAWHGMGGHNILTPSVILYGLLAFSNTIVIHLISLEERNPNRLPPIAYASAIVSGLTVLVLTVLGIGR